MEIFLLLFFFFGSGYLIVFIIDTLLGKSSTSKKYHRRKIENNIIEKIENGDSFNAEELDYLHEQERMNDLINDLSKHYRK